MTEICPDCGREFDTRNGMSVHRQAAHDVPWRDEELMRELYQSQKMQAGDIADRFDTTAGNINRWLDRLEIEKRDPDYEMKRRLWEGPAPYETTERGYTRWSVKQDRERAIVYVHRLLAVAEYGFDVVAGCDTHHKNEIRFDNRPENIEVVDRSDHGTYHSNRRWGNEPVPE